MENAEFQKTVLQTLKDLYDNLGALAIVVKSLEDRVSALGEDVEEMKRDRNYPYKLANLQ